MDIDFIKEIPFYLTVVAAATRVYLRENIKIVLNVEPRFRHCSRMQANSLLVHIDTASPLHFHFALFICLRAKVK